MLCLTRPLMLLANTTSPIVGMINEWGKYIIRCFIIHPGHAIAGRLCSLCTSFYSLSALREIAHFPQMLICSMVIKLVAFFGSSITEIVLPSTNHSETPSTSIHSFKAIAYTFIQSFFMYGSKRYQPKSSDLTRSCSFPIWHWLQLFLTSLFVILTAFCFSNVMSLVFSCIPFRIFLMLNNGSPYSLSKFRSFFSITRLFPFWPSRRTSQTCFQICYCCRLSSQFELPGTLFANWHSFSGNLGFKTLRNWFKFCCQFF